MARHRAIAGGHVAEFGWTGVVRAVVGVIDEVDADDSRPGRVENRRGITSELVVDRVFEFGWVDGTEPVADGVIFGRVLGLGTDVPDRGSTDGCAEHDLSDGVGVEGRPLDAFHGNFGEPVKSK